MQEGSIVVMVRELPQKIREFLAASFTKPPPVPSDTQYMITGFADEELARQAGMKAAIFLDSYPEYEKEGIGLDIDLFAELLPPGLNVEKLFEEKKEPVLA